MKMKDTSINFGAISVANHWLTAALVVGMVVLGLYMADLPKGPDKFQLIDLHKSVGVLILVLALARIFWRLGNRWPKLLGEYSVWQKKSARLVHYVLISVLVLLPLSGWLMSSAGGHTVDVFGLFALPDLIGKNKALGGFFHEFHEIIAWSLIAIVALHFLAAMKHQFVDRDATLPRMLGRGGDQG